MIKGIMIPIYIISGLLVKVELEALNKKIDSLEKILLEIKKKK